jgi:hypothetical protein
MHDSPQQPCPHCARPMMLVADRTQRQWLHLGTRRTQCGPPELAWLEAEMVTATVSAKSGTAPAPVVGDDTGEP